ncbi:hypothetical protein PB2503_02982 [Parvularcula bermudensis HTCC2503]|uniref:Uncharacterized protein n=1 Tax=Parvularcula bermudensis (strain ATCC BAA-594 / HTCC2503 / KCTC 12087) TaxID=314260 RepID=E0TD14_PARBH|nr:hypothetical protein [Parvularcula bermudensis]ADM08673.1 hypothetical protein PB2503_02982 [Parvularcula bermudensis HTCC2503]
MMGRTESVFAVFFILVVGALVAVALVRNGDAREMASYRPLGADTATTTFGTGGIQFSGNVERDLCTCYRQAYAYGSAYQGSKGLERIEYQGGFRYCSTELGAEGGEFWSQGWFKGVSGERPDRSCRSL